MLLTTLCYMERDGKYLLLHRNKRKNDINKDKWIAPGGHAEEGESPEECVIREVFEETGYRLKIVRLRSIVTFVSDESPTDHMCLFTSEDFTGEEKDCDEGELKWVDRSAVYDLDLWTGDRIFLRLIEDKNSPFFTLKLTYSGNTLKSAVLNGDTPVPLDEEDPTFSGLYFCPCCGHPVTGAGSAKYAVCPECNWENDPVQLKDPDFPGGANALSLNDCRKEYRDRKAVRRFE
ncbi:MAG: NUDIX domain-containing protein [Lachnospiraceae bacterium]|nr:NUDIX domain-containing protein [Lachnospiraceae bacterium]